MRTKFGRMFIVVAAILLFTGFKDMVSSFKSPIDLYADDTNVTDLSDTDLIQAEIYASWGCFVEEETTTKNRVGSITNRRSDFFYIVPAYSGDETYYIGLKVPEGEVNQYNEMVDKTYEYLMGESEDLETDVKNVTGRLAKLDKEKYQYFREWFEESEWTAEEIDEYVLPVYIETFKPSDVRNKFFISIGLLFGGIVLVVWGKRAGRKEEAA